jgi:hypothetical protein
MGKAVAGPGARQPQGVETSAKRWRSAEQVGPHRRPLSACLHLNKPLNKLDRRKKGTVATTSVSDGRRPSTPFQGMVLLGPPKPLKPQTDQPRPAGRRRRGQARAVDTIPDSGSARAPKALETPDRPAPTCRSATINQNHTNKSINKNKQTINQPGPAGRRRCGACRPPWRRCGARP